MGQRKLRIGRPSIDVYDLTWQLTRDNHVVNWRYNAENGYTIQTAAGVALLAPVALEHLRDGRTTAAPEGKVTIGSRA